MYRPTPSRQSRFDPHTVSLINPFAMNARRFYLAYLNAGAVAQLNFAICASPFDRLPYKRETARPYQGPPAWQTADHVGDEELCNS